jgi:hypothetical protein
MGFTTVPHAAAVVSRAWRTGVITKTRNVALLFPENWRATASACRS